jgi:hypothetical protein
MNHQIDTNDLEFAEKRYGKLIGWIPGAQDTKTGKINPQVTKAVREDGKFVSVFHVKPVYYETATGHWRPLSEVTLHHGNHKIILNENWWKIHPRYLNWLDKRCKLIGGELLIPSTLKSYPTPYTGIVRSLHESLVPLKVGLTTSTFYPDPNVETSSVDGHCHFDSDATAWATMRTATESASFSDSGTTVQCYVGMWDTIPDKFYLYRAFYLFDTTSISDTDTVDSATFSHKVTTSLVNDDLQITAGNKGFRLIQTTPASNTALSILDFDQVGSTAGASDVLITSFATNTYYDWALNATGLGWISKTGVTKLGMRHLCDVNDEQPVAPGGADDYNLMYSYSSETAGTTEDPKLVVVHSAGTTSTPYKLILLGVG